jgi:KAP family P-loop domain
MAKSPQFNRLQYREEIRRQLEGLNRDKVVAFASRCAWRGAPWLISGWRSPNEQTQWMRMELPKAQATLTLSILWKPNDWDASSLTATIFSSDASSTANSSAAAAAYTASYAIIATYAADAAADAASYAYTAADAEPHRPDIKTRELILKATESDISQLQKGISAEGLLNLPIWPQVPDILPPLLKQWEELGFAAPEAASFLQLLKPIHLKKPDWNQLQQVFSESLPPLINRAGRKLSEPDAPPELKPRVIFYPRLVPTTRVVADDEAEHLTPTAHSCMLALREFLVNDETRPPLTVAVEAPWGGGKSSLMRHLQKALRNDLSPQGEWREFREESIPTVWFNPWKHEAGKTLWATFAVAFERQMAENCDFWQRNWKRVCLTIARLERMEKLMLILRFILWMGGLVVLGGIAYQHSHAGTVAGWKEKLLQFAPWLAVVGGFWAFLKDAVKHLGSPLKLDVSRLLAHNEHADKVDDLHRFHEDFRRMIRAYIPPRKNGRPGKAVVFIDDLDRCEAPKAAELLQSLHQMLNVQEGSRSATDKDAPGIICVLGMDREKVAAAVAAKHEKLLPLLMKPDAATGKVSQTDAMIFGHEFLEKFIQLTLHLPPMQGNDLEEYLESIISTKETMAQKHPTGLSAPAVTDSPADAHASASPLDVMVNGYLSPALSERQERQEQQAAVRRIERVSENLEDGRVVMQCAIYSAAALENNPRKLKQFVNFFRLRLYLAAALNFLDLPDREANKSEAEPPRTIPQGKLSVHHLAKLVALELAAPSEMTTIREATSEHLFEELKKAFPADTKPALHALINYRNDTEPEGYDLANANLHAYFYCFKAETPTA